MKTFKGKAIYTPKGKAGEYAKYACNFFTGCSNNCEYCYCKKGVLAHTWSDTPKLKACFENMQHAEDLFFDEFFKIITELQKNGLFFSFTTDPMLKGKATDSVDVYDRRDYAPLNLFRSIFSICTKHGVPLIILTKRTNWIDAFIQCWEGFTIRRKSRFIIGFTLTGRDDMEPGARQIKQNTTVN